MVAERKRIQPETDGTRGTTLLAHDGLAALTAFFPDGRTRRESTRPFLNTVWTRTVLLYAGDEGCSSARA